jgi:hypothetical protein
MRGGTVFRLLQPVALRSGSRLLTHRGPPGLRPLLQEASSVLHAARLAGLVPVDARAEPEALGLPKSLAAG